MHWSSTRKRHRSRAVNAAGRKSCVCPIGSVIELVRYLVKQLVYQICVQERRGGGGGGELVARQQRVARLRGPRCRGAGGGLRCVIERTDHTRKVPQRAIRLPTFRERPGGFAFEIDQQVAVRRAQYLAKVVIAVHPLRGCRVLRERIVGAGGLRCVFGKLRNLCDQRLSLAMREREKHKV